MAEERAAKTRVVCPSVEQLEFSGPVVCPVEGCGKELPSSSCLAMHVARRHDGLPLERKAGEGSVEFYCPVEGCGRSTLAGKPFPRLGQLKQVCRQVFEPYTSLKTN